MHRSGSCWQVALMPLIQAGHERSSQYRDVGPAEGPTLFACGR